MPQSYRRKIRTYYRPLTRFEQENRVGKDIFTLVPAAIINESHLSDLASRLQFWEIDMPSPSSLLSELKLWKKFWEQYEKSKKMCLPENIANCLKEADRDVYPNISTLLTIGCTLPVSSCEAERSFSGLRRIKTFLRSSMGIERLAGLALMHLHNDLIIDEDKICQLFISKHHRRMFQSCLLFESA